MVNNKKSVSKKATPKKPVSKKAAPKKPVSKKANSNKVSAYCLPCKANVTLDKDIKVIKRKLPNGRTVSILCGKCNDCDVKVCRIISNE